MNGGLRYAKRQLRLVGRRALDAAEGRLGLRDDLTPPRSLMVGGSRHPLIYKTNGEEYLGHFLRLAQLEPTDRIVDIGSGDGRKAVPLTRFLTTGTYAGIDPTKSAVDWCSAHITPRFPNFTFRFIDLRNGQYNPGGTVDPSTVRFPFDDGSADLVMVNSIFTHMLPDDVAHYLGEISRILASGGRAFTTWFLLNPDTRAAISRGTTISRAPRFGPGDGLTCVENDSVPEQAIAFDEDWVRDRCASSGLAVASIRPGSWSGRPQVDGFQDILIATKP